jgi:ATP-dependent Clp protease ATP-binding subunit ClpC
MYAGRKYTTLHYEQTNMLPIHFSEKLSLHARKTLHEAETFARAEKAAVTEPKHLLLALLAESGSLGNLFFENAGLKKDALGTIILKQPGTDISADDRKADTKRPPFSPALKSILSRAYFIANRFHSPYVGTEHLVFALLETPDQGTLEIFRTADIDTEHILDNLEAHLGFENFPNFGKMLDLPEMTLSKRKSSPNTETPFLSQYAFDLGDDAIIRDETLIGREHELSRLIQILGRKNKNNPLLIGEPGVGKTALVAGLGRLILEGKAGRHLSGKRILSLDLALLVAGTNFRGEFETRLKEILHEASLHRDVILFIDEFHTIIGTGNTQGGLDVANILKPALSHGDIQVIGATTLSEYKRHIEKDAALDRRFQTMLVREPSAEETKTLLRKVKKQYETFHEVTLPKELLDLAVEQSVRHLPNRFLPDKALDLLDEASSIAKNRVAETDEAKEIAFLEGDRRLLLNEKEELIREGLYDEASKLLEEERRINDELSALKKRSTSEKEPMASVTVTEDDLLETVAHATGIPIEKLREESDGRHLARLSGTLRKRLIGQEDAIRNIETALLRSAFGLGAPDRPLGSFLLLGPTGVGKTLAAKILAEEFFGGKDTLIRLDMSEFMERHNVAQMIGAPAGYVGYGEGGKLTEKIRRNPYAVVLFDEIEKAHPDVHNILLQILGDGILTDAEGRTVSFRHALIILTSNIGTRGFTERAKIGFGEGKDPLSILAEYESVKGEVLAELKKTLRPELLSRLDHSIVMNALGKNEVESIVRLELSSFKNRLKKRHIDLSFPEQTIRFIAEKSFAPEHGARLVRKNIETFVERPLAEALLARTDKSAHSFILEIAGDTIVARAAGSSKKKGVRRKAAKSTKAKKSTRRVNSKSRK